ncbi:hypothetical protein L3Y34_011462 [Caenorhabditis briggsae]|uniref:Uncharacterized protein n=1 Tax=Caenorhabditis briggsae TaxID=6238 RepID=A0AAE8ZNY7_CAEBR|nr:hypothetical protein L3Y34_011462 [Caenorhabditis briggsae]
MLILQILLKMPIAALFLATSDERMEKLREDCQLENENNKEGANEENNVQANRMEQRVLNRFYFKMMMLFFICAVT